MRLKTLSNQVARVSAAVEDMYQETYQEAHAEEWDLLARLDKFVTPEGRKIIDEWAANKSLDTILMSCDDLNRMEGLLSVVCANIALQAADVRVCHFLKYALSPDPGDRDKEFLRYRQYYEDNGPEALQGIAIAWRKQHLAAIPAAAEMWRHYGVRIRCTTSGVVWGWHMVKTITGKEIPYGGGDEVVTDLGTAEHWINTRRWSYVEEYYPDDRQTETNVG